MIDFLVGQPGHPLLEVPSSGMYFGLSVVLDIRQKEYLTGTRPGAFIYIHHQDEPLIVNDLSLSAPVGMTTLVGIQKNKVCGSGLIITGS